MGIAAEYFAGIDIGSTTTKVVIANGGILHSLIGPTGPEHRKLAVEVVQKALTEANLSIDDIRYLVATGYGRINVPFADKQITEITCHAKGIKGIFPHAKTVIDIGGQDVKGIKIGDNGKPVDFVMNDKCAAGTGRFLEVIADVLGLKVGDMSAIAEESSRPAQISSFCTVFAAQEVSARLAEGVPLCDLVAGIQESVAERILRTVSRLTIEKDVVITGGGAKNRNLVKIFADKLGYDVFVPPEPLITGALGAATLAKELFQAAGDRQGRKKQRDLREVTFFH
jgi:predicted CoA-substrate-specific enzyme activase